MKPLDIVADPGRPVADRETPAPQVDIVVPVKDEERDLAPSVRRLCSYLREQFPFSARVTIADNGSTDRTWAVATALSRELPGVTAIHMEKPGRGRALRAIWSASDAQVLAYMDVDLSTDLNALLPLVAPLLSGHSDIAIGTRLAHGSRVIRGPRREVISRSYNLLLRASLGAEFTDAQCGFKAIRRDQAQVLLPLTEDTGWFFDTELLVLGERAGLRIHEVPVDWIDDTDSRVDVAATALADLRGIARLGGGLMRGTIKVPALREASIRGPHARRTARAGLADRRVQRHRRDQHAGLHRPVPAAAQRHAGPGRQRAQPARHGRGQHRRQPAADLRHQRALARGPAPAQGPAHLRGRPRAHLGRAGRAARGHGVAGPGCGGGGTGRRQPGRDRAPVPALPHMGIRWPPPAARQRRRPGTFPPPAHPSSRDAIQTDGSIH